MSDPPIASDAPPAADAAVDGEAQLGPLRTWPVSYWLSRAGTKRYRYRLLQGLALSLAIDEGVFYWLGRAAGLGGSASQVRLLGSTVFWSSVLGLVAGWVLLGGWFDETTRQWFRQLATRRGYATAVCGSLETVASWRWLALLLAFPVCALATVAAVDVRTPAALGAWTANLLLALLLTQLAAAAIAGAVFALRPLELAFARRTWLLVCIVPELLRPILPGLPTLRLVAEALEAAMRSWGVGG